MNALTKKQQIPSEICSSNENYRTRKAIAKETLDSLGVYAKSIIMIIISLAGGAFTILLDIQVSGQLGRYYFEPIPGENDSSLFGSSTILACTLLTVIALHLSSKAKKQSRLIQLLDVWAPRCAFLFLFGLSLLLLTTMTGDLSTQPGDWEIELPLVSQFVNWLNTSIFEPLGKLFFAIGFSCVIFLSAFALVKFTEWFFDAGRLILQKNKSLVLKQNADEAMSRIKRDYRKKALNVNSELMRSEEDEKDVFALLVYQTLRQIIIESRKHIVPEKQFEPFFNPSGSLSKDDLDRLDKKCTYDYIRSALDDDIDFILETIH